MNAPLFAAWTSLALLLAACGQTAGAAKGGIDTAKIVDSIKTDEVHWNADWKSGDAGRVAAHYAPDAVVMAPGAPAAAGAAAIKSALQQALDDPHFTLVFASDRVDVAASGDLAAAHGTYKQTSTDPATKAVESEAGSYVTVYKPGPGGIWKAVWAINTPGGAAPR